MENRANKLHDRALRLVHPDQSHLAFQQLQMKEKTLSAQFLLQILVIEISPDLALREKYPYSELFWSDYFVSLRIQSECEKIRTRIMPDTDTFYPVSQVKFFCVQIEQMTSEADIFYMKEKTQ